MKIKWSRIRNGDIEAYDITELVVSVTWAGSVAQVARTAEITVINAPQDSNIEKINIGMGEVITLLEDEDIIFYGEVQTKEKKSESGTVVYHCSDLLIHLIRSTVVHNFSNMTPETIAKKICGEFGVEIGNLAATGITIPKMIVDNVTAYEAILMAYKKATSQNGKQYICHMKKNKLSVQIKGKVVENFILSEEQNIVNSVYQETIENMVNVIKIINEHGKQIGEVRKKEWVEKYGIYQQIYKKEKGINERIAANNLLSGIETQIAIETIAGKVECIAGNGVQLHDKATGLDGLFWIEADSHVWENGNHTMSLELSFKNIMDKKGE